MRRCAPSAPALEDERAFLLDSLEDLEREHAAGDLADDDYAALRASYTRRAAAVLRALQGDDAPRAPAPHRGAAAPRAAGGPGDGAGPDAPPARRGRAAPRRRRLVVGGGLVAAAVVVAVVLVATHTASRLPGQTASGTVELSKAEQVRRTLSQAEALEQQGDAAGALRLYHQVLAQDPTQVDALAQSGWLEFEAGVQAGSTAVLDDAESREQAAVRAQPSAYAPHLYLGSMYLAAGDDGDAVDQFQAFLADHPPASQVETAQPFIERAYRGAGVPLPPLPGG
ncbi:MAG TPA: hypothetical protein VLZ77_06150 [Acidimicrobiales bacterium]|nr:hypothetical protein [Acidimicrobiales bacterium]